MEEKIKKRMVIGFMVVMAILFLIIIISAFIQSSKSYEGEQSLLRAILEKALIVLVTGLVIVGLIIGYKRLEEADKKRYLRFVGEDKDEYKLRYGENEFYLKKEEIK